MFIKKQNSDKKSIQFFKFMRNVKEKGLNEITISFSRRPDKTDESIGWFKYDVFIILSAKDVDDFIYYETSKFFYNRSAPLWNNITS